MASSNDASPAAPAQPAPTAQPPSVRGFVDTIRQRHVSGWAWDPRHPQARLEVQVLLDGQPAGRARADRPRPDLRAGGIGDGAHGFEIELARPPAGALRVVASAPDTGAAVPLIIRPPMVATEHRMEPAAETGARLDQLQSAVTQLCAAVERVAEGMRALQADPPERARPVVPDGVFGDWRGAADKLAQQVATLEAVMVRHDAGVAELARKVDDSHRTVQRHGRGHTRAMLAAVALVGALVGAAGGFVAGLFFAP